MTDLPSDWREVRLGEVARLSSGGTPRSGDPRYYGGDIPWAVIRDLNDGTVSATASTITPAGLAESSAKLVPAGALLVAMYGSIGKLGVSSIPMSTNQAIASIIPQGDKLNLAFLFHFMIRSRAALIRQGKGVAQKNIGQATLREWVIPLPALDEQRRIVGAITEVESRLNLGQTYLGDASRRASGLSHTLLRLVRAGSTASDFFAQVVSESGSLPPLSEGWRWSRLGLLADVVGGVTKDSSKDADGYVEVPYLRVANVQRGHLDLSRVTKIRLPHKRAAALRLEPGDILLNEGGDRDKLGRGWVWEGQVENCIHQNHVFRARIKDGQISPRLLSWWANSVGGAWCGQHGRQSVNLASISLSKIREMPVPVPPLDQQVDIEREIADQAEAGERLASAIAAAERRGEALRRSLLDAAFSGRL